MKVGVISDIHGNSIAFRAVLSQLFDQTDQIIFLGDLCGYYPFVEECTELWDEDRIIGIRGNHDQILLECLQNHSLPSADYEQKYGSALHRTILNLSTASLILFESLPLCQSLQLNDVKIRLFHGTPWNILEGRVYPDFKEWERFMDVPEDVILLGHTHYPFVKRYQGKLIVNPGSVGQPRDQSGEACYAILDLQTRRVQHVRVSFDTKRLITDAQMYDPNLSYLVEVLIR